MTTIVSEPYPWPYNGDLRPQNTAFVIIDMQMDFCTKGGYVDSMVTIWRPRAHQSNPFNASSPRCGTRSYVVAISDLNGFKMALP